MTVIPFSEWAPDQADLQDFTNMATNVIPQQGSYGPMSSLAPYSDALPGPCLGAIALEDLQGGINVFAGTKNSLHRLDSADTLWNDYSKTGGYSVVEGDFWEYAQFKSLVIATQISNPVQAYRFGSTVNQFADLSPSAPFAKYAAVAKNFLILGHTTDPVGGHNPDRVWWSANGDPTNWPTPGSALAQQTQSDYTDIVGPQGDITGLVPNLSGCDCAIFFERGVQRMIYVGPPDIFDVFPAQNVRGTKTSNAIVPLGALVYYWGEDGFYVFDGNSSAPIGSNKVDNWFKAHLNLGYQFNMVGAPDFANKAIYWAFPSTRSAGGKCDLIMIYRWDIQKWSMAILTVEWIVRLLAFGVSMDSMPSIGYTNLDTVPFSLDSAVWQGGASILGAVDDQHKLAYFTGTPLQAQLTTKASQIIPNRRAFVTGVRPLVNGGNPVVAVSARVNYDDDEIYTLDVARNVIGTCPFGSDGRYHRARVTIPAGADWTIALGVDVEAIEAGSV